MLDVQISVSEFCFRRLDFRRKECNSFQIVDQDREKHHRILRNWTDRVAMKHQRTQHRIIEEEKTRQILHRQFHHQKQAKNHHVSPQQYNDHD